MNKEWLKTTTERVNIIPRPSDDGTTFDNALVTLSVIPCPTGAHVTTFPGGLIIVCIVGRIDLADERYARVDGEIQQIDPYDAWERSRRGFIPCVYDIRILQNAVVWDYPMFHYYSGRMDEEKGVSLVFVNDRERASESAAAIDHWIQKGTEGLMLQG